MLTSRNNDRNHESNNPNRDTTSMEMRTTSQTITITRVVGKLNVNNADSTDTASDSDDNSNTGSSGSNG